MAPSTWEWGPWAQQGEDWQTQQRKLEQQTQEQQARSALENQTAGNQLRNLLAGKAQEQQYKIEDETRQAANAVPALKTMLGGGTPEGQALGFGPQSTDQDYTGLAKGVPGIATTILNKRLEAAPKPQVVTTPQGAVSSYMQPGKPGEAPTITPIQNNENMAGFGTYDEALAEVNRQMTLNKGSNTPLRPQIHQDSRTGRYMIQQQSAEPMSLQDPFRREYQANIDSGMPLPQATQRYQDRLAAAAGAKQFSISQNTPATESFNLAYSKAKQASNAFDQLHQFTEPEMRAFVLGPGVYGVKGAFNKNAWLNTISGLPGGQAMIQAAGGSQAMLDRFNQFHTLLGSIREMAFVTGGKQLTKTEEDVVLAKLPTGQEKSFSEFQAKMNYAQKLLKAVTDGMIMGNQVPKGDPNYDALMGNVWRSAFMQAGISTQKPENNLRDMQSPNDRLKSKYVK